MSGVTPPHHGEGPLTRVDRRLFDLGLVESRSKAQTLIRHGHITINGRPVRRASTLVGVDDDLHVVSSDDYVSRGAYKLVGAFDAFRGQGLSAPEGLLCLDIGASTGGFCDVLLRRGAHRVIALDVGHGQLSARIAHDPRIIEMSGVNIREVTATMLPFEPQMVVSDLSFISLTYVIPVIERIAADNAAVVLLVKPQFEVGKGHLGKHGVVADPKLREEALQTVITCCRRHGLDVRGSAPSPITGNAGNVEYLLYATRRPR